MDSKEIEKEIKRYLDIQAERFTHDLGFVIDEIKAVEERLNRKIESEIVGLRKELKQEINEVREELKQEIKGVKQELKQEIKEVRQELKKEIREVGQELIAHRDNTEMHVQKAKKKKQAS